jgi:hypothetical protein
MTDYMMGMIFTGILGMIGLAFFLPGQYDDSLGAVKRKAAITVIQVVWGLVWLFPPLLRLWIAGVAA